MRISVKDILTYLFERRNVVENPDATSVSSKDEVIFTWVNDNIVYWHSRQIVLQLGPAITSVYRNKHPNLVSKK